jgi:hypothetical protein
MIQPYNRSFQDYGSGIDGGKNGTVSGTLNLIQACPAMLLTFLQTN